MRNVSNFLLCPVYRRQVTLSKSDNLQILPDIPFLFHSNIFKISSASKLALTNHHHMYTAFPAMLSICPSQNILSPSPSISLILSLCLPASLSFSTSPFSLSLFHTHTHTHTHTQPIESVCSLLSDLFTIHLLCAKPW